MAEVQHACVAGLLERTTALRTPCDLDLLIFFAKHLRTILASEQLAAFLGYGLKDIAESLDRLVDAGLITRTPSPAHPARLYVFSPAGQDDGWLPELLRIASTREGRLTVTGALK